MAETKLYYIPNIQRIVYEGNYDYRLENLPMNRFDTLVFKGKNNTIDFSIRDKDRRYINLIDKTIIASISNTESGELVLQKELEKLDEEKGFARLVLNQLNTNDLELGFYSYAISISEDNGREGFAFTDQAYEIIGNFELKSSPIPNIAKVTEVTTFLENKIDNDVLFKSEPIRPEPGPLHTSVFYLDSFRGRISIEVSIQETVPMDNDWAELTSETFDLDTSGLFYYNIEGNYSWFRFVYNPDELNTGIIEKVLFK